MGAERSHKGLSRRGRGGGSGRGAYYKDLYRNKGGQGQGHCSDTSNDTSNDNSAGMPAASTSAALSRLLSSMDGKQYGHYKQLKGLRFDFEQFTLVFDSIQSDPYASPSKMRVRVSQDIAKFPDSCYSSKARKTASVHYLSRLIHDTIVRYQAKHRSSGKGGWRSAKGGSFRIDCPGQEVVERTSAVMNSDYVEARLTAELPAAGRTILGSAARKMMLETLPQIVKSAMVYEAADGERMQEMVECIEDQENLREQLATKGLVAFIGNGSVLPRHSGVSSLPLDSPAVVEFRSPRDMQVSFKLPNRGKVAGMGIPHGVTLITGGGFHGKSTVLQAVERGVYNHVPGDGRELVVTERTATKIKAEEGRFVCNTDIRPFISNLPFGKDTRRFTTLDASGSTSMAASIQEALEAGAKAFMFDEDTCATNFLVRDGRMQRLVARDSEPITPLVSRIRELWRDKGVSTIVVIGGCGDYLDVADTVLNMHEYTVSNVTSKAKEIAARMPVELEKPSTAYGAAPSRLLGIPKELVSLKPPKAKTRWTISLFPSGKVAGEAVVPPQAHGCGSELEVENEANAAGSTTAGGKKETEWQPMLDVSALDQLATASQTRCIARIVHTIGQRWPERKTVAEWLALFESKDLDDMDRSGVAGDLARPRGVEVAFALNRLRYADFS